MTTIAKDPSSVIDHAFDWSDWLADDDVITQTEWLVSPDEAGGLQTLSPFSEGTSKGILVAGGKPGHLYRLTCRITTNTAKRADRSAVFRVQET